MQRHQDALPEGAKQWLPPKVLLGVFCMLNILIYMDRGSISSNGVNADGIQPEFALSVAQSGLLPAAFMVGLLVSSPIFAEASKHTGAFRLIGFGLLTWAVATAGCGLAVGFWTLLLCRMAVGVGEASFVSLASPFIDDNAPAAVKTQWLAAFYLCIPVGYALGFIFGGLIAGPFGWRASFLIQSAAMTPFIVLCLRAPHVNLRGAREASAAFEAAEAARHHHHSKFVAGLEEAARDVGDLSKRPLYCWVVAAMTAYTAVLGSLSYYGPQAGKEVFSIRAKRADLSFGLITVLTGTFGTLSGGVLLDRAGSSLPNAALLCCGGLAAGGALFIAAFSLAGTFEVFAGVLALGQFALFMTAAPSNALAMWSVPPGLRPLAMSMSVVCMHVFGDVPSPPLLGLLQGHVHNWRVTMSVAALVLFLGAACYGAGVVAARTAVDFRQTGPDAACSSSGEGDADSSGSSRGGLSGAGGEAQARGCPTPDQPLLPGDAVPSDARL